MFLAVLFSLAPPTPPVAQWTFSVGVHDMIVSDVNEYAAGIDAGTSWDVPMRSGAEVLGSLEGLLDQQNDVLDPDHIGLRMMTEHRWIEPFARFGDSTALQGVFDADGKDNTPSSIEWEFRGTYGLAIAYNDGANYASFKTSVGYFAIELDDDVPRTRGYSCLLYTSD